jgi:hypothetical protein
MVVFEIQLMFLFFSVECGERIDKRTNWAGLWL